jgi:hypothetical protein
LQANYEEQEGEKVLLEAVYQNYCKLYCLPRRVEPKKRPEFGKLLRLAFPSVLKRRLGPAGGQVSYYVGIQPIEKQEKQEKQKEGEEREEIEIKEEIEIELEDSEEDVKDFYFLGRRSMQMKEREKEKEREMGNGKEEEEENQALSMAPLQPLFCPTLASFFADILYYDRAVYPTVLYN